MGNDQVELNIQYQAKHSISNSTDTIQDK